MIGEPVRMLHHLACTGGTLIAKCIAGMPNVVLLNEIEPFSRSHLNGSKQPFNPTDLIAALRYSHRDVSNRTIGEMFRVSLQSLKRELDETGRYMVLRDHTHSHFCTGPAICDRPDLRDLAHEIAEVRSVVTVRHPLASYVSLRERRWVHFQPATLEEYALRYTAFLDAYKEVPVYRYEDIVTQPDTVIQKICDDLALSFRKDYQEFLPVFSLSGDSGRTGSVIRPRPERPVPRKIRHEAESCEPYMNLCGRLGYDKAGGTLPE